MNGFIKYILKHPVTVLMAILCMIVFGITSVLDATLEQMPDMDTPMLIVSARYSGASPEDMDELVTQPIEDAISKLEGVETMTSSTGEGSCMVMLEYDYDQDMDEAYDDLKKALQSIRELPSDMDEPSVMEMSSNAQANMSLSLYHKTKENLYDYVDQTVVPEFEKLSTVAEVSTRGGNSQYIKVELQTEKLAQYGLTMSNITSAMNAAQLTYPSGSVVSGNVELDATTSADMDTLDDLLAVPITTKSGNIIYLKDIADVYYADKAMGGKSRYNGMETISIEITKQQQYTAIKLSSQVKKVIETLQAEDPDLVIEIASDEADSTISSLLDVAETMVLAIGISMIILYLFFGDVKASLIVGSSIPVSILITLICLTSIGFSLNIITMSGLVLSVGMMVDNSIVTLDSCFRAKERTEGMGANEYGKAALEGAGEVFMSILGSTLTTCVVFIPLININGMSGEMFRPLGYVIVISMAASLLSAVSIVPLTYLLYKPQEKHTAPLSGLMVTLDRLYRKIFPSLMRHKGIVMLTSVVLAVIAVLMGTNMKTELISADSNGQISVSISTRPGLLDEKADDILTAVEKVVSEDEDVESYMMRYNGSSGTVTGYIKDSAKKRADDIAEKWERELADLENCTITVSAGSTMSFMRRTSDYEAIIQGTQYEELQEVSAKIVNELIARDDVMNVHSSIENSAPVLSVNVDMVAATAQGLTPAQIGSQVKNYLDGATIATLTIDGNEVDVKAEYPEGDYDTVPQLERVFIEKTDGTKVALTDVATIQYKDSPSSITKENKEYQVTITASFVDGDVSSALDQEVINPNLTGTITRGTSSMDRMMSTEFSALYKAIAIATFLVFVVMSAQFESMKFSLMVMTTIPFSLAGSFLLLGVTGVSMSMTSLIGFLILVGTVVNNGILFVDTTNQNRTTHGMELNKALEEAGATRIRPILMTSLTTILSMIPMAMAMGDSGSTTQGLALVDIGGLTFGVLVALLILPVYYILINHGREMKTLDI